MIEDAARNTHLGKRATALLKYYAGCGKGFRPALAEIQKHTGIASNKISEIRKELVDRAVISYEPTDAISINWKTIRILAGLPEPLFEEPAGDKEVLKTKRYHFYPAEDFNLRSPKKTIGQLMAMYRFKGKPKELTRAVEDFFNAMRRMTVDDYRIFSIGVLGMEPPLSF